VASTSFRAVAGSRRRAPTDERVGVPTPTERIEVTVHLRGDAAAVSRQVRQAGADPIGARTHLTRRQFGRRFGARQEDIAAVRRFARANGLDVARVERAMRTVHLAGTVEAMQRAFDVELASYRDGGVTYRARSGVVRVPDWLAPSVVAVLGLDTRPAVTPHIRFAAAPAVSYSPPDLSRLYQFPTDADGSGQCVAILEFGGGYRPADLQQYFSALGLTPPTVQAVSVDGGANDPTGDPSSADGEVALDIEVVGAIAPGARIVVYFAPNTDQGFADAILAAVHDADNQPSVISISWGGPEESWTTQARDAVNRAFSAAATMGVTVLAASGDNGSSDGVDDGAAHVDFPASSPTVVGCGGTTLTASGDQISSEVVWNGGATGGATGGGVSAVFPAPTFQRAINPVSTNPDRRAGRGVPDVSGDGDPATGYDVLVDGQSIVVGGTSAVAPLWAGLLALVHQLLDAPVAPLLPTLYTDAASVFRDVTSGDNGDYRAQSGWDACTGLGSPNGIALVTAMGG
jgi:kumamolisin